MALGYLISSALQLEDINGKPLTGGYLNVYVHGTTNRAVTYKDYSGNLNANDIVLNGKGMAVIIADSGRAYDVYCYDRHGVEQWSRLNVCTIGSGSGGGGGEEYYAGNGIDITNDTISVDLDGASLTNGANGLSVTLPVPDTTGASQGDVLVVGQNGLEWTTLSSDYFLATYGTTTFTEIANAHRQGKLVFLYKTGSEAGVRYYLIPLDDLFFTEDPSTSYAKFNGYITPDTYSGIASWPCYKVTGANAWSTDPCTAIISPASGDVGKVYKAYAANRAGWVSVNEVPSSTTSDANKVLTVDSQGVPGWAPAQAPISAGSGINIANDVISRRVQLVTTNSSYAYVRNIIDNGDLPVLDIANGSLHNLFVCTMYRGSDIQFVGSAYGQTTLYTLASNSTWTSQILEPQILASSANKILAVNASGTDAEWRTWVPVPAYAFNDRNKVLKVVTSGSSVSLAWDQPSGYTSWETDWASGYSHNHTVTADEVTAGYYDMYQAYAADADTTSMITSPIRVNLVWDTWCTSGATSNYVSSIDFAIGVAGGSYRDMFTDNSPAHEVHKDWFVYPHYLLHTRCNSIRIRYHLTANATAGVQFSNEVSGLVDQVR